MLQLVCPCVFQRPTHHPSQMTIDFKSGVMSIAILNRVLEWCYTDTLDFEGMNTTDLLVRASSSLSIMSFCDSPPDLGTVACIYTL